MTPGKYNSIESIGALSWTGSAAIGGAIMDKWGYRVCFGVTGVFYTAGAVLILLLVPLIPPEQAASAHAGESGDSTRQQHGPETVALANQGASG